MDKAVGDALFAGTVNLSGTIELRITAPAAQSTLARIIHAVERAQASRAPTQRFVERFAAVYTPAVFVLALAVVVMNDDLRRWRWRSSTTRRCGWRCSPTSARACWSSATGCGCCARPGRA